MGFGILFVVFFHLYSLRRLNSRKNGQKCLQIEMFLQSPHYKLVLEPLKPFRSEPMVWYKIKVDVHVQMSICIIHEIISVNVLGHVPVLQDPHAFSKNLID